MISDASARAGAPRTARTATPRVLQVIACERLAGTERMVCAQVLRGHPERVAYEVAILAAPGPVAGCLEAGGITVHSLGEPGWIAKGRRLRALVQRGRFEIVNTYGFKTTMLARAVLSDRLRGPVARPALVCGVRALLTTEVEDTSSLKARAVTLAERWTRASVDMWDANSPGAAAHIRDLGVPADRVRCIPNGIDLDKWPPRSPRAIDSPPQILCVSRFVPRKRHVDLVAALAKLRDAGVAFRAHLVGDGPTDRRVRALVRSQGLEQQVLFHGALDHAAIRELMQTMSVFVLVSTWEGMPGAVMEAMAAGLPVVGTDVNGIDELVVDGVTGRLVPPRAPDRLAATLIESLSDPDRLEAMGRAGRERIRREFTLETMIDRKESLYAEVAELTR